MIQNSTVKVMALFTGFGIAAGGCDNETRSSESKENVHSSSSLPPDEQQKLNELSLKLGRFYERRLRDASDTLLKNSTDQAEVTPKNMREETPDRSVLAIKILDKASRFVDEERISKCQSAEELYSSALSNRFRLESDETMSIDENVFKEWKSKRRGDHSKCYVIRRAELLEELDTTVSGRGYTAKFSSKLYTDSEISKIADSLLRAGLLFEYVPRNLYGSSHKKSGGFATLSLLEMASSKWDIPYIGDNYRLDELGCISRKDGAYIDPIVEMEKKSNIVIQGVSEFDGDVSLFAIAIKNYDGTSGWILGQITKGHILDSWEGCRSNQEKITYNKTSPKDIKAVLPLILENFQFEDLNTGLK